MIPPSEATPAKTLPECGQTFLGTSNIAVPHSVVGGRFVPDVDIVQTARQFELADLERS